MLSLWQLLQIHACTKCRMCEEICPPLLVSREKVLSGLNRIETIKGIVRRAIPLIGRLFFKEKDRKGALKDLEFSAFRCTLCGACEMRCPVGLSLKDIWIALRHELYKEGYYPKKIDMIKENIEEEHNVFGEENEERAEWIEDLEEAEDIIKEGAEILYFTGCVSSFFPVAQNIPIAFLDILYKTGKRIALLKGEEWCCGFPLLGSGTLDLFNTLRDHNVEVIKRKGAEKVVFTCPSCYKIWHEFYPKDPEPMHSTELLLDIIRDGVKMRDLDLKVTYHDPCDLGRGLGIYDEPREIIRAIPGIRFIELPDNRERCLCCGGGGNLEMIDPDLSSEIAKEKIRQIESTGADMVISSCQQCVRTMTTFVRRNRLSLKVMDISQLLSMALKGG